MTHQLTIGDLVTSDAVGRVFATRAKKAAKSSPEDAFEFQCVTMKLPPFTRQALFAKQAMGRLWRCDFCWAPYHLLVEIDGLVPYHVGKGRHQTMDGQQEDMRKGNAAIQLGYSVLHFSQHMVKKGEAIETTMRVLHDRGWRPTTSHSPTPET